MRRLGGVRGVEDAVLSRGITATLQNMGFLFPGMGLLIGLALSRLGIFSDKLSGTEKMIAEQVKAIGEYLKAGNFDEANQLATFPLFQQIMSVSEGHEVGNLFFLAIYGNAVRTGDYTKALRFAALVDADQDAFDAWLANEEALLAQEQARETVAVDPGSGYATGAVESREVWDDEHGRYITQIMTEDGWRELRATGDAGGGD